MKNVKFSGLKGLFLFLMVVVILVSAPQAALANVRVVNGGQLPYYARFAANEIYADGEWVAIAFYRLPSCVPVDFNLLEFFDWVNCWTCTPTTEGFEIWKTAPGVDLAPFQQVLTGLGAVPVWFVSWDEMEAAISDGVLKIEELRAFESLIIGSASYYHEVLRPYGGAKVSVLQLNAYGTLEDGRSFVFEASHAESMFKVTISFGS